MKNNNSNREFDALVEELKKLPRSTVSILVPERMAQFQAACVILQKLAEATDATFAAETNEMDGYASIRLEGVDFEFHDGDAFAVVSHLANNFEVYKLKNGKLRLAFMFYGVTKGLGGVR